MQAKKIATDFLVANSNQGLKNASSIELKDAGDLFSFPSFQSGNRKSTSDDLKEIYIFNIGDNDGFIVVSGDDATFPVLAYSTSGHAIPSKTPQNVIKWLEGYRKQIQFIKSNGILPTETITSFWNGNFINAAGAKASVSPLIKTQWDQSPYVNALCPFDEAYGELTVTGCPATAMAQIMKFWAYPSKGIGFHSYQHNKYGTLSANFGTTEYDWAAMPDIVDGPNEAVAMLMYHCGVAVEMEYNVAEEGGSGSYVVKDPNGNYPDEQTVENALTAYFGYSSTVKGIIRADYSDANWKALLKAELDAGRPVQYAGCGQGGHTFVCDGYDENDFFHMNWGWGGYYDGFFILDALNPGSGGIGSGEGTYNEDQEALIGIKPPTATSLSYKLEISSDVNIDNNTISYGEAFTVSTDILNSGNDSFNGDYCAAAFDANNVFIDNVEIKQGWNLSPLSHYTNGISFSTEGLLSLLPGKYKVYIFSRTTGGNWEIINASKGDLLTSDYVEIEVINENMLTLYSEILVLTPTIYAHESLSVKLDVANNSSEDFTGIFDVSLYNLEGEFVATIEEKTNMNLSSDSHYSNGLTFTTENADVEPGTYLLALLHQWDGYDYELTGSSDIFINPIKVIVQEKPFEKDMYEENNEIADSYPLNISFNSNSVNIKTSGSNIHVGNDWDFYSFDLEKGYNYEIRIRLNDSYNSEDGASYTVDALFLYSLDGTSWSETYDDVLPSLISTSGNKTVYCVVSPYFLGKTGSYQLNIDVERTVSNSVSNPQSYVEPEVFPVPCRDMIMISCQENEVEYSIIDLNGKILFQGFTIDNGAPISISTLPKGLFMMQIKTNDTTYFRKIIKE